MWILKLFLLNLISFHSKYTSNINVTKAWQYYKKIANNWNQKQSF